MLVCFRFVFVCRFVFVYSFVFSFCMFLFACFLSVCFLCLFFVCLFLFLFFYSFVCFVGVQSGSLVDIHLVLKPPLPFINTFLLHAMTMYIHTVSYKMLVFFLTKLYFGLKFKNFQKLIVRHQYVTVGWGCSHFS